LAISNRLPKLENLLAVYGVTILFTYGWTLYWFTWKLPSWLQYLTLKEIFVVGCNGLTTNLYESTLILVAVLIPAFIFPDTRWGQEFVFRSSITIIILSITIMVLLGIFVRVDDIGQYFLYCAAALLVSHFALSRFTWFQHAIESFADRCTIFVYLAFPLSLLALIFLTMRTYWA